MAARQLLSLTASLGPFGLAFPAEPEAVARLSCTGSRPFLTGIHAHRLAAPLGSRDRYEWRAVCGGTLGSWSELGPAGLLWAEAETGEAVCPRPQSVSGLLVTRARLERSWRPGGHDMYSFGLLCGELHASVELLEPRGEVQEQQRRVCPPESFISAIEISRGHEPHGSYDLYEFKIECSEMVDAQEPKATVASEAGGDARAGERPAASAYEEAGPASIGSRTSRGAGAEEAGSRNIPAGIAGRRGGAASRSSPLVGTRNSDEAEEPPAAAAAAARREQATPAAASARRGQSAPAAAADGLGDGDVQHPNETSATDARAAREATREAKRMQEEMEVLAAMLRQRRANKAQADDADAADVFGRVRSTAEESLRSVESKHGTFGEDDTQEVAAVGTAQDGAEDPEAAQEATSADTGAGASRASSGGAHAVDGLDERLDAVQERIKKLTEDGAEGKSSVDPEAAAGFTSTGGVASPGEPSASGSGAAAEASNADVETEPTRGGTPAPLKGGKPSLQNWPGLDDDDESALEAEAINLDDA